MRVYQKSVAALSIALYAINVAHAESLTPPYEPMNNSFYVCYLERRVDSVVYTPLAAYEKYQYTDCIISRQNCCTHIIERPNRPPQKLQLFGWFDNYPQSLNAFYRCAYSN